MKIKGRNVNLNIWHYIYLPFKKNEITFIKNDIPINKLLEKKNSEIYNLQRRHLENELIGVDDAFSKSLVMGGKIHLVMAPCICKESLRQMWKFQV